MATANERHELWLDAQEWPSAENNWLSRKAHPLTPTPPDYKFVEVVALKDVELGPDGSTARLNAHKELQQSPPQPQTHRGFREGLSLIHI